jgi:hypothetical protein
VVLEYVSVTAFVWEPHPYYYEAIAARGATRAPAYRSEEHF